MPTYQYRCTACGHELEAVQNFSDAALTECPACAGRLRKVFGSVGVVFKGSGFYKTDSRTSSSSGGSASRPKETTGTGIAAESTTSGGEAKSAGSSGSTSGSSITSESGSSSGSSKSGAVPGSAAA